MFVTQCFGGGREASASGAATPGMVWRWLGGVSVQQELESVAPERGDASRPLGVANLGQGKAELGAQGPPIQPAHCTVSLRADIELMRG